MDRRGTRRRTGRSRLHLEICCGCADDSVPVTEGSRSPTNRMGMTRTRRLDNLPTDVGSTRLSRLAALATIALAAGLAAWLTGAVHAQPTNAVPAERLDRAIVSGENAGYHAVASESDRVGPAQQPEWTARRAFAETDVYVIPPGEVEFNQYYVLSHPRHADPEHFFESEFEFGLPWRTQFDLELNYSLHNGAGRYDSTLIELPHALADWDRIPLNPTLVPGWRFNQGTDDAWFARLLLAEDFGPRVHFGSNLSFERQVSGELETTYELNLAANYVLINQKLSVGAEFLLEHEIADETEFDDDGEAETATVRTTTAMLGPTVLFRPSRSTYLSVVPLFGLTSDAPTIEAFFIFGMDFEPFAHRSATQELDVNRDGVSPVRRPR